MVEDLAQTKTQSSWGDWIWGTQDHVLACTVSKEGSTPPLQWLLSPFVLSETKEMDSKLSSSFTGDTHPRKAPHLLSHYLPKILSLHTFSWSVIVQHIHCGKWTHDIYGSILCKKIQTLLYKCINCQTDWS